jgi:hypothetical protein
LNVANMKRHIIALLVIPSILLLLMVVSCKSESDIDVEYKGPTQKFQAADLLGWTYTLQTCEKVLTMQFNDDHLVPTTEVTRQFFTHKFSAPLYNWQIDDSSILRITSTSGPIAAYKLVSIDGEKVNVVNLKSGQLEHYTRSR